MKILFILPSLKPTAPIFVAKDIIIGILSKNTNVTIKVVYFDDSKVKIDFPVSTDRISFFSKIDFSSYDIVHSHMMRPDFFVFVHTLFKRNKTKFVTTLHSVFTDDLRDHYGFFKSFLLSSVWALSWSKFDKISVLSRYSKNFYSKKLPFYKKKITVINNGRDIDELIIDNIRRSNTYLNIKNIKNINNIILGTCCIVRNIKGLKQVLHVLKLNEKLEFVLIGDGPDLIELNKLAIELDVADRFHAFGRIEHAYAFNQLFDVYVMPSLSEGFGLALLEAAAQKCSIVTSDIDIFKEIFPVEVFHFKLNDIHDFEKKINDAYSSNNSLSAYYKYKECYTVDVMSSNYLILYENLTNKRV